MILKNNMEQIIEQTINSFDFGFVVTVNILTYIIIKIVDEINGSSPVGEWTKRSITLAVIILLGTIYYIIGTETRLLLNSAILAPVAWSWIIKPIIKKLKIDYKQN